MEDKKRKIAEAHLSNAIEKKRPGSLYSADASFLLLQDIKKLLEQVVDIQLEAAGKPAVEREPLPVPETRGGRRNWLWPNRKKN